MRRISQLIGTSLASLIFLLVSFGQARADTIVLTFDELGDNEQIRDFYNGGFSSGDLDDVGGGGSGPGPDYDIVFPSTSSRGSSSSSADWRDSCPSCVAPTSPIVLSISREVMINSLAGFDSGFSFFYNNFADEDITVSIFDGADGMGTLLGFSELDATAEEFVPFGISFSGTARSVIISGRAHFDNMTFGSATPAPATVPEPATLLLLSTGLGGGIAMKVRRRYKGDSMR